MVQTQRCVATLNTTTVNNHYLQVPPKQGVVVAFIKKDAVVFEPVSAKTPKTIEEPKSGKHAFSSTTLPHTK